MFERFRAEYGYLRDAIEVGEPWRHESFSEVEGYADFSSEFSGASFAGGLYRIHDDQTGPLALTLIAQAFPEFAARACPFGFDWLGRQFTVDLGRIVEGQPLVLLLEPGTGEVLEIPASFSVFHDEELIEYADVALAREFFAVWSAVNSDSLPLRRDQCAGYRVPLFLGGADTAENIELSDLEVYWSICGQLRLGSMRLPPESVISRIVEG
ncbi:T6SS immunity protein Tdi1 domain-containing protein [Arthrobacter sp. SA17]